jgi:hypothetical protein
MTRQLTRNILVAALLAGVTTASAESGKIFLACTGTEHSRYGDKTADGPWSGSIGIDLDAKVALFPTLPTTQITNVGANTISFMQGKPSAQYTFGSRCGCAGYSVPVPHAKDYGGTCWANDPDAHGHPGCVAPFDMVAGMISRVTREARIRWMQYGVEEGFDTEVVWKLTCKSAAQQF